jgi:hypothetical protein
MSTGFYLLSLDPEEEPCYDKRYISEFRDSDEYAFAVQRCAVVR